MSCENCPALPKEQLLQRARFIDQRRRQLRWVHVQLSIRREMKPLPGQLHSHTDGDVIVVLDLEPDESLLSKRTARELVNRVQKLRKKCNLVPTDTVEMWFDCAAPRERGAQAAANGVARNGAASDGAASNGAGSSAAGNVANGKAGARDAANGAANGSAGAAAADNGGARSNAAEAELCAVVAKERAFLDDALGGCTVLPASRRPRGAVELGREPTTLVLPSDANVDDRRRADCTSSQRVQECAGAGFRGCTCGGCRRVCGIQGAGATSRGVWRGGGFCGGCDGWREAEAAARHTHFLARCRCA